MRPATRRATPTVAVVDPLSLRSVDGELVVGFRVTPSAKRTRTQGRYGDRIKVQVSAPPEDDRANDELVAAMTRWLGLSAGCVTIRSGHKSRDKQLSFTGIGESELRALLERLIDLESPG